MRNLLCMLVLGCSAASFAQSGEIKGFVYDSKNGDRLNTVSLSLDGTDRIMS